MLLFITSCNEELIKVEDSNITLEHYQELQKSDTCVVYFYMDNPARGYFYKIDDPKTIYKIQGSDVGNTIIIMFGVLLLVSVIIHIVRGD